MQGAEALVFNHEVGVGEFDVAEDAGSQVSQQVIQRGIVLAQG
jgi:hypothetical protein